MALSTIGRNQLNTGIDDNSDATAITIDSSEKVAIGTTSTAAGQVTIQGSGSPRQLVITDDGAEKLQIFQVGNDATIEAGSGGSNSTNLIFKTSSSGTESEAMRIDSGGDATFTGYVGAEGGNAPTGGFHLKDTGGTSRPRITNDASNATVIRAGSATGNVKFNNFANTTELVQIDDTGIVDAAAFTADYGTSFGILDSTAIGDSNIPYNSFGTPNSTYYRWVLPKAGTYLLSSNMRIRLWGVNGYIKARLYNNTTSTVIAGGNLTGTTLGSEAHIRMLFENAGNNGAQQFNVNITANYIITTTADNQDIHHQLNSNNNSANSSLQSDSNGRNIHWWQRIG